MVFRGAATCELGLHSKHDTVELQEGICRFPLNWHRTMNSSNHYTSCSFLVPLLAGIMLIQDIRVHLMGFSCLPWLDLSDDKLVHTALETSRRCW